LPAELQQIGALGQEKESSIPQGAAIELPFHCVEVIAFKGAEHNLANLRIVAGNLELFHRAADGHVVDEDLRLFHSTNSYAAQLTELKVAQVLNAHPHAAPYNGQHQTQRAASRPQQEEA